VVIYADGKTVEPVQIQLVPCLLTTAQSAYLQALGTRIRRVLNRLLRTYFNDPVLQQVLPLTEDEQAWIKQLAPHGFPEPATVFERLDTNLTADDPEWPKTFRILEFNSVGVGCLHFMPIANRLLAERILPMLAPTLDLATCQPTTDHRLLLRRTLEQHAKAIGRSTCVTALVERREASAGGADEILYVSRWLQEQGLPTVVVDPRELELRNGEVVHHDLVIDVIYRDFNLHEIISIENHGGHVDAVKHAFRHNQVVSGLTGEFDHKSLLELLSNPEFERYFTVSQRRTFQDFMPWTRLLRERTTTDPARTEVDLVPYVRTHREQLVLKPNRAYGGSDVVIGCDATQAAWEEALGRALGKPDTWVAQEIATLPSAEFFNPENHRSSAPTEFVTIGFTATPHGIAFVGRSSTDRIVNISRGGNLVPIFILRRPS